MSPETSTAGSDGSFRLGQWLVQPELNRIVGEGRTLQIEPRVMEVLVHLAARAGRVVSRQELREAVWGTTVVTDQTMTRAIWELRNALGDDHEAPRIIETIRKGGYRLIAPVEVVGPAAFPAPAIAPAEAEEGGWRGFLRSIPLLWPALAIGLILVGGAFWLYVSSRGERARPSLLEAIPLTTFPGRERYPAISPDGTRVAFSWKDESDERYCIYVKQVNAESRLRLTDGVRDDLYPTWSPDGSIVAFLRRANPFAIFVVPAIGGPAREVAPVGFGIHGLDWSPDGAWIAFTSYEGYGSPTGIQLVSPETGEKRTLTDPPPQSATYSWPRFSPDGHTIAFLRSSNSVQRDVYLLPVNGGEVRRLSRLLCPMSGLAWTADGSRLVLSASQGQDHLLWLVSTHDGSAAILPTPIIPALHPSVSRGTNRLVYENQSVDRDIWRLQLGAQDAESATASPFVGSTRVDCCAEFSPDGSRVLFLSTRTGHKEVWVCDSDGNDARRLTSLEALSVWQPRWSPDGTRIAFSAFLNEHARAFVMDVESGLTRCLSTTPRHEIVDSWSRDGQWIYRHCDSDSAWFAERVRPDGTEASRLDIDGYPVVFERKNGEVLFLKSDAPGIWKARPFGSEAPPTSHEEELLVEPKHMGGWTDVTFADEGTYFVRRSPEGEILGLFDYATGKPDTLAHLDGLANAFLTVSRDRKTVLFDRPERDEIDVILVPSF